MDEMRVTVIGAGVVGLAVAAALAERYPDVAVIERHPSFGRETSSRNSEVIHAGLHHPPTWLKARLCVQGRRLLHEYCAAHGVPYRRIGKVIVATSPAEADKLLALRAQGVANGVEGLALLDAAGLRRVEPGAKGLAALHSPETGIVDSHALMASLHRQAAASGALFAFGSAVERLHPVAGGFEIGLAGDDWRFRSRLVVNAAGLEADHVAALAGIDVDAAGYRLRYCKGSYFSYTGRSPVSMLVYPLPHADAGVLGVHATLGLDGRLRFGPDAEFVDEPDYRVAEEKRGDFFAGAARIVSGLDPDLLQPEMAGIRPRLRGEGARDFLIRREEDRGLPGLINLVGIESPGLTAALAIARLVAGLADEVAA